LQPEERNIAQVFQFPVIYDTMTVRQNLAFPLINRRVPQDEITKRVNDMIEVLIWPTRQIDRGARPDSG
jgi:glycerol transport system ATP-binding protein